MSVHREMLSDICTVCHVVGRKTVRYTVMLTTSSQTELAKQVWQSIERSRAL